MTFWIFRQNNSGGSFVLDMTQGIGVWVIVEASSQAHALERAAAVGIYMDGVELGVDCPCCGDRWSEPEEYVTSRERAWFYHGYLHTLDGQILRIAADELERMLR